jgi:hypothetical protein
VKKTSTRVIKLPKKYIDENAKLLIEKKIKAKLKTDITNIIIKKKVKPKVEKRERNRQAAHRYRVRRANEFELLSLENTNLKEKYNSMVLNINSLKTQMITTVITNRDIIIQLDKIINYNK